MKLATYTEICFRNQKLFSCCSDFSLSAVKDLWNASIDIHEIQMNYNVTNASQTDLCKVVWVKFCASC